MQIGVLGTGMVGRAIAGKLVTLGHDVRLGSRTFDNATAREWVESTGARASQGTFADAASHGELAFNCTPGSVSLSVIESLPPDALTDKVLVDVSNPLDFSGGFPPSLSVVNTDSLGERLQRTLPDTYVVKTLNTVNADLMVNPSLLADPHDLFVAGDDSGAKTSVRSLLMAFGWSDEHIHDLGGITAARGMEMYLPLWLQLMGVVGSPTFNVHVVRADHPTG
jgi:predicted dinucleotide-binding enzyme